MILTFLFYLQVISIPSPVLSSGQLIPRHNSFRHPEILKKCSLYAGHVQQQGKSKSDQWIVHQKIDKQDEIKAFQHYLRYGAVNSA